MYGRTLARHHTVQQMLSYLLVGCICERIYGVLGRSFSIRTFSDKKERKKRKRFEGGKVEGKNCERKKEQRGGRIRYKNKLGHQLRCKAINSSRYRKTFRASTSSPLCCRFLG